MDELKVGQAFELIKQAMIDDEPEKPGSYAHSWHCNIAMSCFDAAKADVKDKPLHYMTDEQWHRIANDAASRFMRLCFGVQTRG